jgi:hypothetical protein
MKPQTNAEDPQPQLNKAFLCVVLSLLSFGIVLIGATLVLR